MHMEALPKTMMMSEGHMGKKKKKKKDKGAVDELGRGTNGICQLLNSPFLFLDNTFSFGQTVFLIIDNCTFGLASIPISLFPPLHQRKLHFSLSQFPVLRVFFVCVYGI